jgi:predicted alpha/beta-fold hydrolase
LANGVVGSIAKGLGPNGSSIIGLAAAAISNPSAALHTAENMAIGYATRMASNYVNNAVNSAVQSISGEVSSFVSENISQPISQAFGDLTGSLSNSFGEFTSSFSFGGVDSVDTASLFSDSSAYDAGAGWSS